MADKEKVDYQIRRLNEIQKSRELEGSSSSLRKGMPLKE
jgi:hypothetical protein